MDFASALNRSIYGLYYDLAGHLPSKSLFVIRLVVYIPVYSCFCDGWCEWAVDSHYFIFISWLLWLWLVAFVFYCNRLSVQTQFSLPWFSCRTDTYRSFLGRLCFLLRLLYKICIFMFSSFFFACFLRWVTFIVCVILHWHIF